MLAPIATLFFLVSAWFVVAILADIFSSKGRILAVLRGEARPEPVPAVIVRSRPSVTARRKPMRAQPQWRAAA
jgi:hypothetical protein